MEPQDDPWRQRDAKSPSQLVARSESFLQDRSPFAFVALRQRHDHVRRRSCDRTRHRRRLRNRQAREVAPQDVGDGPALSGQTRRPDDAQPDAMPGPSAAESIQVAVLLDFENGALDVLPAERAADRYAQFLTRNSIRSQADDAEPRHSP